MIQESNVIGEFFSTYATIAHSNSD